MHVTYIFWNPKLLHLVEHYSCVLVFGCIDVEKKVWCDVLGSTVYQIANSSKVKVIV